MSFMGFGGGAPEAPGFGAAPDPFASISQGVDDEEEEALDFEDTYDGLGDQLQEENDDFNDDTFGGGGDASTEKAPGKDFDFFGNTSRVTDAINEEAIRYSRQQPPSKPLLASSTSQSSKKPFKTGYEAYRDPVHISNLQADPSLWGTAPAKPEPIQHAQNASISAPSAASAAGPSRKILTLDEIENLMFSQPQKPAESQAPSKSMYPSSNAQVSQAQAFSQQIPAMMPHGSQSNVPMAMPYAQQQQRQFQSPRNQPLTQPAQANRHFQRSSQDIQVELPTHSSPHPPVAGSAFIPPPQQILQRPPEQSQHKQVREAQGASQPLKILQNPNRQSTQPGMPNAARGSEGTASSMEPRMIMKGPAGEPVPMPIITHPSQLQDLTKEQRQAFMIEDAKRAKRNHKIFLLSKDNGLMTPQDKNFITRIQLQQLMTATGTVNESDSSNALAEDFYYQVYSQIENRPRQNPHQPLSNFAQTYLFQTGNRPGAMGRRLNRGGDHMNRMQQQVQRAVEAAKQKPKGKQLVIEGSLGKISFSNAKTPKPLLNINRNETKVSQATLSSSDRKIVLKNIEAVYNTLMKMEDHDRRQLPRPSDGSDAPAASEALIEWEEAYQALNKKLWDELKVMEPIIPESTVLHPFIAFLSYPKGKKAIPRIFSQIDSEQRLTILTISMVQLDTLDVIRYNLPQFSAQVSPSVAREQVELFLQTVMPTLFSYVTKAPLSIIIGLVGLLLDRVNVLAISHTRVGLEILTMLLSQAEIIRKNEATNEEEWKSWLGIYNRLFDTIEPILADIFPGPVSAGQDVFVWQFLATVGTGASPEQQQRLVLAVKDRVMETVRQSKTLPADMASQRRADVNLFMQAIGLDVDYLDD